MSVKKEIEDKPTFTDEEFKLWDYYAGIIFEGISALIPGRGGEWVAERAYGQALCMMRMAKRVREGYVPSDGAPPPPELVEVKYYDDETGETFVRMELLQDCCCPNMPDDH